MSRTGWGSFFVLCVAFSAFAVDTSTSLLSKVIQAHGGKEAFYKLRDVQFTLTVRDATTGKTEDSIEKYLFDREQSRGEYAGGKIESFNSQTVADPETFAQVRYRRKANYFRFAMPFKLLDSGALHSYLGQQKVGSKMYTVMEISYPQGVGDSPARFRLFIDPKTHLLDQYSFTEASSHKIYRVTLEYREIHGLKLATKRQYWSQMSWNAVSVGKLAWEEDLRKIQFWNGFAPEDFKNRLH